jgi:hypothetical protein
VLVLLLAMVHHLHGLGVYTRAGAACSHVCLPRATCRYCTERKKASKQARRAVDFDKARVSLSTMPHLP